MLAKIIATFHLKHISLNTGVESKEWLNHHFKLPGQQFFLKGHHNKPEEIDLPLLKIPPRMNPTKCFNVKN